MYIYTYIYIHIYIYIYIYIMCIIMIKSVGFTCRRNVTNNLHPNLHFAARAAASSQVGHVDGNVLRQALALAPDHPASTRALGP